MSIVIRQKNLKYFIFFAYEVVLSGTKKEQITMKAICSFLVLLRRIELRTP